MRFQRLVVRLLVVAAILVAVLIVAVGYVVYERRGLIVTIRNAATSDLPVTQIVVAVDGDRGSIEQLRRGEARKMKLEFDGESSVELWFKLGNEQCHWKGGYVEGTGGYRELLEIQACDQVREETTLFP